MYPNLRAKQFSGTAPIAGEKISLNKLGFRLIVKNTDAGAGTLGLSLDGGRTFFPIAAGETFAEDVRVHYFWVRGEGAATADYSIVAFVG